MLDRYPLALLGSVPEERFCLSSGLLGSETHWFQAGLHGLVLHQGTF